MFEFLLLGGAFFAIGLTYNVFLPMRRLPQRSVPSALTRKYHLSGFPTEVKVPAGSKLIGRTALEERVSERYRMNVLEIPRGEQKISAQSPHYS